MNSKTSYYSILLSLLTKSIKLELLAKNYGNKCFNAVHGGPQSSMTFSQKVRQRKNWSTRFWCSAKLTNVKVVRDKMDSPIKTAHLNSKFCKPWLIICEQVIQDESSSRAANVNSLYKYPNKIPFMYKKRGKKIWADYKTLTGT